MAPFIFDDDISATPAGALAKCNAAQMPANKKSGNDKEAIKAWRSWQDHEPMSFPLDVYPMVQNKKASDRHTSKGHSYTTGKSIQTQQRVQCGRSRLTGHRPEIPQGARTKINYNFIVTQYIVFVKNYVLYIASQIFSKNFFEKVQKNRGTDSYLYYRWPRTRGRHAISGTLKTKEHGIKRDTGSMDSMR